MPMKQEVVFFVEKIRNQKAILCGSLQEGKITIHLHNPFTKSCILTYYAFRKIGFEGTKTLKNRGEFFYSLLASCPQAASISLPRLLRTVIITFLFRRY